MLNSIYMGVVFLKDRGYFNVFFINKLKGVGLGFCIYVVYSSLFLTLTVQMRTV